MRTRPIGLALIAFAVLAFASGCGADEISAAELRERVDASERVDAKINYSGVYEFDGEPTDWTYTVARRGADLRFSVPPNSASWFAGEERVPTDIIRVDGVLYGCFTIVDQDDTCTPEASSDADRALDILESLAFNYGEFLPDDVSVRSAADRELAGVNAECLEFTGDVDQLTDIDGEFCFSPEGALLAHRLVTVYENGKRESSIGQATAYSTKVTDEDFVLPYPVRLPAPEGD